jgi:hypothetical protein
MIFGWLASLLRINVRDAVKYGRPVKSFAMGGRCAVCCGSFTWTGQVLRRIARLVLRLGNGGLRIYDDVRWSPTGLMMGFRR